MRYSGWVLHNEPARRGARFAFTLIAFIACVLGVTASARIGNIPPRNVTLIYVGAADCAPCQAWARDYRQAFLKSRQFERITYREVMSPRLFDLMDDSFWPDDLRGYRAGIDRRAGVPLWIIVADGTIVRKAQGLSEWRAVVMQEIAALVR